MSNRRLLRWILLLALFARIFCNPASASQAGKEYNNSEKELNATYQKVLAIISDPQDKRLFVGVQRSWIKFRDSKVAFHARYFPGSKGGLFVAIEMTQERTKELKILLTDSAKDAHEHPFPE